MMKYFLSLILLAATTFTKAQIKLEQKDLNNLIAIAELYSYNTDASGPKFAKSIDSLRTPKLDALVGPRFKVLLMMKNNKKILEFCGKLPRFNGKEYFYFKNFDYADFDWIGYDKTVAYNEWHISSFYSTLIAQFSASAELKDKKRMQEIYFNSILHEPKYFKFTKSKDELQSFYDKFR
nr:hypothetical protein [uncultured Sphingobacterium sp.]